VNEEMKEERMRMLEREFGGSEKEKAHRGRHIGEGEHVVGGVDEKGNLITVGPKKRGLVRVLQGLLALCTATTSIYAAIVRVINPMLFFRDIHAH
jgi:hypothetical protein